MDCYKVRHIRENPSICVTVPGSKSITNRALLIAAMAEGTTRLEGVLFSDDSRVFLQALQEFGFPVSIDEEKRCVTVTGYGGRIPAGEAFVHVGSAGTAARFLTAFAAMGEGCYRLDASEQMKKRPMKELLDALRELGAKIQCLEAEDTFPMEIRGIGSNKRTMEGSAGVFLNIDRSSQFLSALLLCAPLRFSDLNIHLTGNRSARSYVAMTEQMMKQFGHPGIRRKGENNYQVCAASYRSGLYQIEPDVSAACYFYSIAAIAGGQACVKYMRKDSLQGDRKFLQVLEQMGCGLQWRDGQLWLQGPEPGKLHGISVDMSDFSDQALTLAAIAPYADSPVHIKNVGHIRGQECDRLQAIQENLTRMQVRCEVTEDAVVIYPSRPKPARIETYNDHRVAMAFAVSGVMTEGIEIENPSCCRKTFEEYFQVLDTILLDKSAPGV